MHQENSDLFVLHFGTPVNELEVHILTETLSAFSTAIQEINSSMFTGKGISIRVRPFEEGSFEVPFELIEFLVAGMLSAPNLPSIPEIIKVLREFIEIKIRLKGRPPQKVDSTGDGVQITTNEGEVIHVERVTGDLVVNNVQINNSFNRSMNRLADDKSIDRLELQDRNRKKLVAVDSEEFSYFGSPDRVSEDGTRVREIRAVLNVRKIVFDFTSMWGFYYDGVKISAKILDKEFLEQVQTEGRFGNGDTLDVLLRIHQEFDVGVNTYVNKKYEIVEVLSHQPRPRDQELFGA